MARLPDERHSFVAAALDAVAEACQVPSDIAYFTAADRDPAALCERCVRECSVYIGVFQVRFAYDEFMEYVLGRGVGWTK